ncbi:hypothetical protein WRP3_044 [Lactococcus phage WRP3]|uniref:Uncharacterized protein n=1 Tax=Lactococcus phage WRP3 TaxID=1560313 RepID=A0A0D3MSR4_9CAUD|nr:hypothetical protein ACQ37_gp044 [Lactococcus phage WRP3]AIX12547.1 hypothetical protein WRP3_044 [Lactococcus phage WRP3]
MNQKDFYKQLTQGLRITAKIQSIEGLNIHKISNPDFDLHISIPFTKLSTYGNCVLVKINRNVITLQFEKAIHKKYYSNSSYKIETKIIDYRYSFKENMVILTEEEILKFLRKDFVTEI